MPLRRVFVFLMLFALFAPPFAHAAAVRALRQSARDVSPHSAAISLPAGLYSLTQLAAELSTPGVPVRVDPAFAHRLGFVRLKNRSQADALHAIESAFAVKAQPSPAPATGFVLVSDPDTASREHQWLNRFVSFLQSEVNKQASDYAALLEMSPEQARQEWAKRSQEQAALAAKTRAGTPSEEAFLAAYDASYRAQKVFEEVQRAPERMNDGLWYLGDKNIVSRLVGGAVRSGYGSAAAARSTTGEALPFATFSHGQDSYHLEIHPGAARTERNGALVISGFGSGLLRRLFGSAASSAPAFDERFAGLLGSDAAEWMKAEQSATTAFLNSEAVGKPFRLNPTLPSDTVSARVWQWCAAFDREAAIEVIPSLDTAEAPGFALADLIRYRDDWSARNENGVAVFTNRLVFLDRSRVWELGALQTLVMARVQKLQTTANPAVPATGSNSFINNQNAFPVSLLPIFAQRAKAGTPYAGWQWPEFATPRNRFYHYTPQFLDDAAAIELLWTNLTKAQQEGPPGRTDIPLNAFSPPTLRLLAQWFAGTGTLSARQPAFVGYLRQYGHLYLERASDGRQLQASVGFDDAQSRDLPSLMPTHSPRLMLLLDE